jgi:hypothetical protein
MLLLGQGLIAQPKFSGSALGASQAAVPETGETETDKEKERALNRRVEITIIQKSTAGAKSPTTSRGKAGSIDNPPFPRLNPADLIKPPSEEELRNERINRMLRTPLPDFKRPKQSLSGLINEKIDEATGKVLKEFGVPRKYHDIIKKGARSLVQKGAESLLDESLDQAGISGNKKEAIKKAIEAGVKTEL